MSLIVVGWLVSLRSSSPPPVGLSSLYALGSTLLAAYALAIGDPVFTALNVLAALFAGLNIYRAVRPPGRRDAGQEAG